MSLINNKRWFLCCEREDVNGEPQPPYIHPCECPRISTIGRIEIKDAQLLSNEDTEEDAIDRATTQGRNGLYGSAWEIPYPSLYYPRPFQWSRGYYAVIVSRLQPGAIYKVRVFFERREAILNRWGHYVDENGDPSEWTSVDDDGKAMFDEHIFTATAQAMVVPTTGTWEGDADEDITINRDKVTPTMELPLVRGWRYKVDRYRDYVELALPSETPDETP